MDLCRNLRWKTFSREDGDPAEVFASLARGGVPCTCLRTCQVWGPDDDIVTASLCNRERACFEKDPISDEPLT